MSLNKSAVRLLIPVSFGFSIITFFIFFTKLGLASYFYVVEGDFEFIWKEALLAAVKGGATAGVVLGFGIWGMAKMEAAKEK